MKKSVVIRITPEAKVRIKTKASKKNMSMIGYVEELSKEDLTKPLKSVVS